MYFAGIDPSTTATGLVLLDGTNVALATSITTDLKLPSDRIRFILDRINKALLGDVPAVVCVEEPLLRGNGSLWRAALYGVIRCGRSKWCDSTVPVAPTQLVKFATGSGKMTGKDNVRLGVFKRWGFEHESNDVVDAFVLAKLAHCVAGGSDGWLRHEAEVAIRVRAYWRNPNLGV